MPVFFSRPPTVFTLASRRDCHFLDTMAGSVPRWVTVSAGTVETAEEICGPGTTRFSLGSSAG